MTTLRMRFKLAHSHSRCGVAALVWLAALLSGLAAPAPSSPSISFRNATEAAGIRFLHTDGSSGRRYIVETVASGLGLLDYNNDGWLDIFFLNASPLPGTPPPEPMPTSALYRNNRDGTFTDVTVQAGLDSPGYGMGCVVGDYDNDGHEDLFISYYGGQRLYRNRGDGRFEDVTRRTGLNPDLEFHVGAGCVFLDYDRDGHLDVFVSDYLVFDPAQHKPHSFANVPIYVGPKSCPGLPSRLYRNQGDGTFNDVSQAAGISQYVGYGMGIVSADFDGDGWPDIYVGNDAQENFLFHNQRNGTFAEIGVASGTAYDQYGDAQGTMGSNAGDYDGDGRFDILVTDYQNQVNTLYRNLGRMQFEDVTVRTGAGIGSRPLVTWGCGIVDFDNDGVPEIFT
ncbi:VCBS repeat-containing protein, partial [bacterium]|nr:VCBS repeat-containing protein [bacterium]